MANIESYRRRAVERLLEDQSLTDDLIDDAARPLLDWGIAQVEKLVEQATETSQQQLEEQLSALRSKLKRVGKKAGETAPEAQAERVRELLSEVETSSHIPADLTLEKKDDG